VEGDGALAKRGNFACCCLGGGLGIAESNGYVGSGGGESERDGAAKATGAAGDQCGFSMQ
jgi:hypothetical protein